MIIAAIYGGLGNQMFQYAMGRALSLRLGAPLKLDLSILPMERGTPRSYGLEPFALAGEPATDEEIRAVTGRDLPRAARLIRKVAGAIVPRAGWTYLKERGPGFDPSVLDAKGDVYLEGYWQSEKYFADVKETIRSDFAFKEEPTGRNRELLDRIASTDSVSIHVRRGDYLTNPAAVEQLGFRGADYVERAVARVKEVCADPVYFVFSDDIAWCRDHLDPGGETVFVDHNGAAAHHEDLRLMSRCRHHVVANSTFSWWGAWLNPDPERRVVAPREWYRGDPDRSRDLVPESWERA